MSLDITVTKRKKITCPNCSEVVAYKDDGCEDSGGRAWYDVLEDIGYYVPYEERTEENDWYGKDMTLNADQMLKVLNFVACYEVYNGKYIYNMISAAMCGGDDVVINANW